MRTLIVEDDTAGLSSLLGQKVTIFTSGYFYTGKLISVNYREVKLEDPSIVYETGPFSDKEWKDCQSLCVKYWYVAIPAIESYGVMK